MKVVVFGGAGFIGQHVVKRLFKHKHEAVIFDRYIPLGKKSVIPDEIDMTGVFWGDITDKTAVAAVMDKADAFINLAGILGTSETVNNPYPSVKTNIVGALNALEEARRTKKPGVQITVGNHFMNNSYAITKSTAGRFCLMYNKEHGTRVAVVRGLNAYGPGQKHKPVRKIIPNFVTRALRGEPIEIYGDGSQVMDMIYVEDLAEILVRALKAKRVNKIFEAGTGRKTTVAFIAEQVGKMVHKLYKPYAEGASMWENKPMRPGEPKGSVVLGNPSTLASLFNGRAPQLMKLEKGLLKTIKWYEKNYPWKKD